MKAAPISRLFRHFVSIVGGTLVSSAICPETTAYRRRLFLWRERLGISMGVGRKLISSRSARTPQGNSPVFSAEASYQRTRNGIPARTSRNAHDTRGAAAVYHEFSRLLERSPDPNETMKRSFFSRGSEKQTRDASATVENVQLPDSFQMIERLAQPAVPRVTSVTMQRTK